MFIAKLRCTRKASIPGQWLGKETRMLQVRRHMLNLKLSPSYTLPDEVVADVDVLGPWGGTRVIVGHAKSTHPCYPPSPT